MKGSSSIRYLVLLALVACVSSQPGQVGEPSRISQWIFGSELYKTHRPFVLEALQAARPQLFDGTQRMMVVWVDNQPYGLEILQSIRVDEVSKLHFLTATETVMYHGNAFDLPSVEVIFRGIHE